MSATTVFGGFIVDELRVVSKVFRFQWLNLETVANKLGDLMYG